MVSTRRAEPKKDYAEGDRVEIVRTDGIDVGTLLYRADKVVTAAASSFPSNNTSSNHPAHWMIATKGGGEEIMSELALGRVLELDSDQSTMSTTTGGRGAIMSISIAKPATTMTATATMAYSDESSGTDASSSSKAPGAADFAAATNKVSKPIVNKRTSNNVKNNVAKSKQRGGGNSSAAAAAAAAAAPALGGANGSSSHHGTRATRSKGTDDLWTGIEAVTLPVVKKAPATVAGGAAHTKKGNHNPDIIKVQLKTGILYLYRGRQQRRAEFVRTK